MFIAPLVTIVKTWRQPRCPSVGEWINKPWDIQAMGKKMSYQAMKEMYKT